jgi:hypothetical protein
MICYKQVLKHLVLGLIEFWHFKISASGVLAFEKVVLAFEN